MRKLTIYLLIFGSLLTSCHSSKHLAQLKNQREQLSKKFGIELNKRDNIQLYTEAAKWLGTPYRYGGNSKRGVDCSGLIVQIYKQVYQKELHRTTQQIVDKNCRKVGKSNLQEGQLVFFNTSTKKRKGVNHVGLFLKDGYFIHTSSSKGVMVNQLKEKYYKDTWKQGGRVK